MDWMSELGRRLAMLFRRDRFNRDLQDEMKLHLELRQELHVAQGVPRDEARSTAHRNFGNTGVLREISGDAWGWRWLEHFATDLRYGVRGLLRTRAFTAIAVLTLALGIGANTAIFSVVNTVLLNPLLYKNPDRLVTLLHDEDNPVSVANYIDWRDQSRSFDTMAAAEFWSPNITGSDPPEHLRGHRVTANLFPMLGVDPMLGRFFLSGEDQKGAEHEVILSHHLWHRRFNSDPGVIGRPIILNGESYVVVGVMPPNFKFAPFWARDAELWIPAAFGDRIHNRGGNSLRIFARLKPGITLSQARAEIATITTRLEHQYPGTNRDVVVTALKENVVGKIETPLFIVLGAVGFVLLIACANVAHMLLARTSDRQKEIAVRTALGAGRTRVILQFLTENVLLAILGAASGLLLAFWGTRTLVTLSPANIPGIERVAIDSHVVLFLLAITVLTAVVFGLAPAMHAAVGNLSGALKEGGRGGTDSVGRNGLRNILVASEFALAFVLLIGAGLMIRSFYALQSVDPGFNPHNVLSMVVSVAGSIEAQPNRRSIFYRQLLQQVRALPGVQSVGAINHVPLVGDLWGWPFSIEGRPKPRPGESPSGAYRIVMPGYFETMRLPILRGRSITEKDDAAAPGVAIINERAASTYWPGEDPIGKRITFDDRPSSPFWLTVIGIAKDAKQYDWAAKPFPEIYRAALQNHEFLDSPEPHSSYISLVIRTSGDPAEMAPAVKRTIWSFDRNLPISEVVTMDQAVTDATSQPRFEMFLMAVFGMVALVLAAVGIYGVMNYSVSRRTHEIGIRMSLGASRSDVLRLVLRQGMMQALLGTMFGIAGALLLSQLMSKMLYGVPPTDPITFLGVGIVLAFAALLAVCAPAHKATRIEPMAALRND